jgi:hypothetical protein
LLLIPGDGKNPLPRICTTLKLPNLAIVLVFAKLDSGSVPSTPPTVASSL